MPFACSISTWRSQCPEVSGWRWDAFDADYAFRDFEFPLPSSADWPTLHMISPPFRKKDCAIIYFERCRFFYIARSDIVSMPSGGKVSIGLAKAGRATAQSHREAP